MSRNVVAAGGWPTLKGRSALIVDDNATNLEILQNHLTRVGVRTRLVTNADAALGVLQESADTGIRFDFILIDKILPTMDGCELARRIRADETLAGTDRHPEFVGGHVRRNVLRAGALADQAGAPVPSCTNAWPRRTPAESWIPRSRRNRRRRRETPRSIPACGSCWSKTTK